ncbi:MAG: 2-amino-4-hydroxy-6-hydroxymethyldihydropteridine diphosphokinase [Betaproteobacteria bacterium]|nr:2-amino-4-hydroxy-6-hydroxymethyldihydropteridine diphosphokinase [Betaproteobacteria bacterium]
MVRAFVAVGSNIDAAANVRHAVLRLRRLARLKAISTVYLTAALGRLHESPYYNCVAELETDQPPLALKQGLHRIEDALGRQRVADKFAARTIDLDLIVYDELAMETAGLRLPDPDIMDRPFLAIPLWELAPDLILPGRNMAIAAIAARLRAEMMKPLEGYTAHLRREAIHGAES